MFLNIIVNSWCTFVNFPSDPPKPSHRLLAMLHLRTLAEKQTTSTILFRVQNKCRTSFLSFSMLLARSWILGIFQPYVCIKKGSFKKRVQVNKLPFIHILYLFVVIVFDCVNVIL